jgi:ectoine hydroxylase-related dioxygenase (phytanoyl-CoA dioxygenase family)
MAFDLEQHVSAIESRGYTVIEDFLSAPVLAEVRRCLSYYLGSHNGRNSFEGTRTERVYTLVARARVFWDIVLDARILALCDRFLLPNSCSRRHRPSASVPARSRSRFTATTRSIICPGRGP